MKRLTPQLKRARPGRPKLFVLQEHQLLDIPRLSQLPAGASRGYFNVFLDCARLGRSYARKVNFSNKLFTHQGYRSRFLTGMSWLLVFTTSISLMRWDFRDFNITILNPPKAQAQAASPTTFYFKSDARTANTAFGVAGPTAENSGDTDEVSGSPTGKTTAYSMAPIYGPINPSDTSDSVTGTRSNAANSDNLWFRTFMMPLANGTAFTTSTTFSFAVSADESNAGANAFMRSFVYVYDSNSNSNAATLSVATEDNGEIGTGDQGLTWSGTQPAADYTSDSYDYLAVELWVLFKNTNGTQYTVTLRWGGNVAIVAGTGATAPASYLTIGTITGDITSDPIYFLPTTTPPEPGPNASQTGDTFETSTLDARRMSTVPGSGVEANIHTTTTTGSGSYNYRMNTFISPPLAAQTIPAGTWLIHVHGTTDNVSVNAQLRGMIYTWDADDTIGDTIIAVANSGTYWISGVTNSQLEMTWSGSAATISAGERLVAEWNFVTINPGANTAGVAHRFGDNPSTVSTTIYDSAILPPMNYASSPAAVSWLGATYDLGNYRFDQDGDGEAHGGNWTNGDGNAIGEYTAAAFNTGIIFRLRIQIRNIGSESDTLQPKLEYQINSPPGSWTEIVSGSGTIQIVANGNFAEPTATTAQLTDLKTGYDFTAGWMEENSSPSSDTTMIRWNYTEYEWSLQAIGVSETYNIRVTDNGSAFGTYTYTPQIAIAGYTPKMNNWRWYADEATDTSAGALTTAYAAENTVSPQEENGKSIPYKLRINLTETGGIAENNSRKILQYSTDQSTWFIVGSTTDTLIAWRFYDGGGADNAVINTVVLTDSSGASKGILDESSSSAPSNSDHPASTTVEWEFSIENYDATANTTYYFNIKDEVLDANIPLGALKTYPQVTTATAYNLSVSSPAGVYLGSFQLGSTPPHEYVFVGGEEITIRDNRGQTSGNSSGWSLTADVTTELNVGGYTITKANTYWISNSITGLYAAPTTGISTQSGSYMSSAVTAASVSGSGKNGLGGFTQLPTLRLYGMTGVGNYTGVITMTLT